MLFGIGVASVAVCGLGMIEVLRSVLIVETSDKTPVDKMDPDEALSEQADQQGEQPTCPACGDPLQHAADIEAGRHFFCEPTEEDHDGG